MLQSNFVGYFPFLSFIKALADKRVLIFILATSKAVLGKIFASDYASPTPANLTQAVMDMQNAYNYAFLEQVRKKRG